MPENIDSCGRADAACSSVVDRVPVGVPLPAESPRLAGEDPEYVRLLAQIGTELPPIIVSRRTNRVIDGMHRLSAARIRGDETIAVRYFDGDDDAAFLMAVEINMRHGLPLSPADREAAAARVLASHPHWSDRTIAERTGLAWTTIGAIRRRGGPDLPQPAARVGKDGRSRPVDGRVGRVLASKEIAARPDASLRQIAKAAGISVATARDVRDRLRRGEDPVPDRLRRDTGPAGRLTEVVDVQATVRGLRSDPSLRLTESGRALLRWLDGHVIGGDECTAVAAAVPPHCVEVIEAIARRCAENWSELATALRNYNRTTG
ncbi:streptomycin biosynthesis protein [Actinocrispum sp. NPDC049592]|uniref:streptomycin biosynthesis protein n=1 Tax=Actinocrispum sp. NPDC049592 TaxID=3154835 RepID=UPI00342779CF